MDVYLSTTYPIKSCPVGVFSPKYNIFPLPYPLVNKYIFGLCKAVLGINF